MQNFMNPDRVERIKCLWTIHFELLDPDIQQFVTREDGGVLALIDPFDEEVVVYERITYDTATVIEAGGIVVCRLDM